MTFLEWCRSLGATYDGERLLVPGRGVKRVCTLDMMRVMNQRRKDFWLEL